MLLDLASLASIRAFAEAFKKNFGADVRLKRLICNAGVLNYGPRCVCMCVCLYACVCMSVGGRARECTCALVCERVVGRRVDVPTGWICGCMFCGRPAVCV